MPTVVQGIVVQGTVVQGTEVQETVVQATVQEAMQATVQEAVQDSVPETVVAGSLVERSVAAETTGRRSAIELPDWARVSDRRRAHIERVTALLDGWASALALGDAERRLWHDAGRLHDALRDEDGSRLRALAGDDASPVELLHGPAAATYLASRGESRDELLAAIRWHTVGSPVWGRAGRALYMADYLEPGRSFSREDRAFLARMVPVDFDGVFRQVLRHRMEWTIREGKALFPQTVELWNLVRGDG